MRAIWALAVKDLRLLLYDKIGFFFVAGYPLLFVIFFGYVTARLYSGGASAHAIALAVVDEDGSAAAGRLSKALAAQTALEIDPAASRAAGEDLVRRGKRAACVVIPAGFQNTLDGIFTGEVLQPEVIVDPSKPMESAMTQGLLQAALFQVLRDTFTDRGAMQAQVHRSREELRDAVDVPLTDRVVLETFLSALDRFFENYDFGGSAPTTTSAPTSAAAGGVASWQPFRLQVHEITRAAAPGGRKHGAFSIVVPQGITWGVMACAATFAAALVVERTRGTLPRLTVAPIPRWQLLAGKGLACLLSTLAVMVGMLVLARLVFGVHPDSPVLLALAVVCIALAVVGVMMLFAVLGKTEAAVSGLSWAVLVIMAMFGGGMLPLSQMGGALRTASAVSIFRWSIQALDGAIWRNYTLADMWLPCAVLLAIGVVGFAVGAALFRWR